MFCDNCPEVAVKVSSFFIIVQTFIFDCAHSCILDNRVPLVLVVEFRVCAIVQNYIAVI